MLTSFIEAVSIYFGGLIMTGTRKTKLSLLFLCAAMLGLPYVPAQAGTITEFTGQDNGVAVSGPFPNSNAAQTSFLAAAAAYGAIGTESFESQALGFQNTPYTMTGGVGTFTLSGFDNGFTVGPIGGTPGYSGIANVGVPGCAGLCGFPLSGSQYLALTDNNVTFNFNNPTHSFGFFMTGSQSTGPFSVTFNDGSSQSITDFPLNTSGGGGYLAFTDTSAFSSLTITYQGDIWGMDVVSFNNSVSLSATPLPAALPLFASGLGALGLLGWRRKRKAAALAA